MFLKKIFAILAIGLFVSSCEMTPDEIQPITDPAFIDYPPGVVGNGTDGTDGEVQPPI